MSCENVSAIIATVIAATVAIVSEFLPFIPGVEGNGIVHTIISGLKKNFPLQAEVSISNPESVVIPESVAEETATL
jgi:hypothetical protein